MPHHILISKFNFIIIFRIDNINWKNLTHDIYKNVFFLGPYCKFSENGLFH